MTISLDNFLQKYLGQSWGYPKGEFVGECLSIVKLYTKECFGIDPPPSGSGSAYGYWTNFPSPLGTVFDKVENTPTLIPEKGWVVILKPWSTNQYGHIAIVETGCTTKTLLNFAQNWTSKTFQKESNNYNNVVGYLKPKVIISDPEMTPEEVNILKFIKEQGANEGKVREAFGALADIPYKDRQIVEQSAKIKELTEQVDGLNNKMVSLNNLIKDLDNQIVSLNNQVIELQKKLDANANANSPENANISQLISLLIKKLLGGGSKTI